MNDETCIECIAKAQIGYSYRGFFVYQFVDSNRISRDRTWFSAFDETKPVYTQNEYLKEKLLPNWYPSVDAAFSAIDDFFEKSTGE